MFLRMSKTFQDGGRMEELMNKFHDSINNVLLRLGKAEISLKQAQHEAFKIHSDGKEGLNNFANRLRKIADLSNSAIYFRLFGSVI